MKTLAVDAVLVAVQNNLPSDMGGQPSITVTLQLLTPVWYSQIDRMDVSVDRETYKSIFTDNFDVSDRYEIVIRKKEKKL